MPRPSPSRRRLREEAEARAEDAVREWDALVIELDAARQANQSESEAVARPRRRAEEAEARAAAAIVERDALARELETAYQASRETRRGSRTPGSKRSMPNTARLMQEWQDDVVRLEGAIRERDLIAAERDALATELEAVRQAASAAQAEDRARQQEFYDAAEQRIRELELQLLQPDFEAEEAAAIAVAARPASSPQTAPAAAAARGSGDPSYNSPPRRASRHAFNQDVQIQIDGSATQLVDFSTTGAQVISPTALKPNRMVKVSLPFEESAVSCRGKIVWARLEPPTAGGAFCYRAGVLFTSVDEAAVQAFIVQHSATAR